MRGWSKAKAFRIVREQHLLCKLCNRVAKNIHHIDGNTKNNNLSNLIFICTRCHKIIHTQNKVDHVDPNSKFGKEAIYLRNRFYSGKLTRLG